VFEDAQAVAGVGLRGDDRGGGGNGSGGKLRERRPAQLLGFRV